MSREEIVHVTNCAWGDARRLKKALETFVDKAAMFEQKAPTCDSKKILLPCKIPVTREKSGQKSLSDLQSEGQQDRVPKPLSCDQKRTSRGENSIASTKDQKSKKRSNTKSMLLEHLQIPADSHARISSDRKQLSGRSSVGSMTVPVSCAQDPVLRQDHTGRSLVERLSERVWGVKPKEEEPAQWGGDYVSEFHPAAKENCINVFRSLRKEFENLREECNKFWEERPTLQGLTQEERHRKRNQCLICLNLLKDLLDSRLAFLTEIQKDMVRASFIRFNRLLHEPALSIAIQDCTRVDIEHEIALISVAVKAMNNVQPGSEIALAMISGIYYRVKRSTLSQEEDEFVGLKEIHRLGIEIIRILNGPHLKNETVRKLFSYASLLLVGRF
ncbi:hypothetical protein R1sor_024748 [Riccia sorocarpa]|uniref:Uncharacterized protein n=1 Tax=Riccia sorocarpa TaxID=122646 RepID=A0ABD3GTM2_9MARC